MAKSDIKMESALAVMDRVAQELGLIVGDTSFGKKVQGPTNKHRIYIQKGQYLGRVDTTLPLEPDDPAYVQLSAPNGSVKCHVLPDLEQLERCLRMLGDGGLGVQVPNKARPFTAPKAPASRTPKAIAVPVPAEALVEAPVDRARMELQERIDIIRQRARAARIRMVLDNPQRYGELTEAEAEALVDGKLGQGVTVDDVAEAARNARLAESQELLEESGLDVVVA